MWKINILIAAFFIICSAGLAAEPKEELKHIKKELDIHKKKLQETKKTELNILEDLKKVSREIEEIEEKIKSHRMKIKDLQIKIAQTEKEIKSYSSQLETRRSYLVSRIKGIQRFYYQPDPLLIILMEDDTTEALRLIRNIQKITNIDKELINKFKAELKRLTAVQNELKNLYASLKTEEEALKKAEEAQKKKKKEKEILLVKVRQNKVLYEKKIRELEENARRLTRLLKETEKRQTRTGRTDVSLPEGGFTKMKGTLVWPVSGRVVSHYGTQKDPVFDIPVFRSGIHINAAPGAEVKASAEGKVVYANYFKGYQNLVIISHGEGYYTVYGNLGSITVKEGAYVKGGQVIGTVADNSNIGTPAVYFEVRYRGKPLNPEQWLKR